MKKLLSVAGALLMLTAFSCRDAAEKEIFNADPETVLTNSNSWLNYHQRNIHLSRDYAAVDSFSKPISRQQFLQALSSGDYAAFKLTTADKANKYQLYKLPQGTDRMIRLILKDNGRKELAKYSLEGTELPDFNYTDLNGKLFNRENTKGKIVALKCWFIACVVCVQEMPALNDVVKEYGKSGDVIFLSLAFDTEKKLKTFLTKKKFDYAVAYASQDHMSQSLKVGEYPTHFIINRQGRVSRVVNYADDMVYHLKKELNK